MELFLLRGSTGRITANSAGVFRSLQVFACIRPRPPFSSAATSLGASRHHTVASRRINKDLRRLFTRFVAIRASSEMFVRIFCPFFFFFSNQVVYHLSIKLVSIISVRCDLHHDVAWHGKREFAGEIKIPNQLILK